MRQMKNEDADHAEHHYDGFLEKIKSEVEDLSSSPPSFDITTYPADYPIETLVDKWSRKDIVIPIFQRKFVWKLPQSSKLIESFLLGLPVPPIFLFQEEPDNDLLVVDGQQRLKSLAQFYDGYFGDEPIKGHRPIFALTGLHPKSRFLDKTYEGLDLADRKRLDSTVLRCYIIRQLQPKGDTSIYQVYERLNTGGTSLHPQEIRNCVCRGRFNNLLLTLNKSNTWREIIGKPVPDKRQRDVELILRFFALHYDLDNYEKPMKESLNKFMESHKNSTPDEITTYGTLFEKTAQIVRDCLGPNPFRIHTGLNVAVFDAVFVAVASNLHRPMGRLKTRYKGLIQDQDFYRLAESGTTATDVLKKRLRYAKKKLFGK
jgi:hypothetical protein